MLLRLLSHDLRPGVYSIPTRQHGLACAANLDLPLARVEGLEVVD